MNEQEKLLTLKQAGQLPWLPKRRNNKSLSFTTLWRWAHDGLNGARLKTVYVGSTLCTTESYLREFFDEITRLRIQG